MWQPACEAQLYYIHVHLHCGSVRTSEYLSIEQKLFQHSGPAIAFISTRTRTSLAPSPSSVAVLIQNEKRRTGLTAVGPLWPRWNITCHPQSVTFTRQPNEHEKPMWSGKFSFSGCLQLWSLSFFCSSTVLILANPLGSESFYASSKR